MGLDAEAIDKIIEVTTEPSTPTIDGAVYVKTYHGLTLLPRPEVKPIVLTSLASIIDYLATEETEEQRLVHVASFYAVNVHGPLGVNETRQCYAQARAKMTQPDTGYIPPDQRIIELLTMFEDTPERGQLVQLLSKLKAERTIQTEDTGASQKVTISQGVASVAQVTVPNPVKLKPYRTFLEVPQPESLFLVRFQDHRDGVPKVRLLEADGGMWQVDAVAHIKAFLEASLAHYGLEQRVAVLA